MIFHGGLNCWVSSRIYDFLLVLINLQRKEVAHKGGFFFQNDQICMQSIAVTSPFPVLSYEERVPQKSKSWRSRKIILLLYLQTQEF